MDLPHCVASDLPRVSTADLPLSPASHLPRGSTADLPYYRLLPTCHVATLLHGLPYYRLLPTCHVAALLTCYYRHVLQWRKRTEQECACTLHESRKASVEGRDGERENALAANIVSWYAISFVRHRRLIIRRSRCLLYVSSVFPSTPRLCDVWFYACHIKAQSYFVVHVFVPSDVLSLKPTRRLADGLLMITWKDNLSLGESAAPGKKGSPSLVWAIAKVFGPSLLLAHSCKFVCDILTFVGPILQG